MAFEILIPELSNKPKSSKDAIISILTQEWPLTLKEIYYKIKKRYSYSSTYQSVYKAVNELLDKNVLQKKDLKYEINIDWIKRMQSFTDVVETNYYAKDKMQNLSGIKDSKSAQDLIVINFGNLLDAEKYLYYFIKQELFKRKEENICYQINDLWMPILYLRAEYNFYNRLNQKGHKAYMLFSGKSDIEKYNKGLYEDINLKIKGVKTRFQNETIGFLDYFIQIFIPENLNNKIQRYLKENNNIELIKCLSDDNGIRVIITKDKDLSENFRKQVIMHFNK